ncbi:DUF4328 domain-containing protein [Amycolatopsis anabasis]|uniref:DUF4328 domain-containing protein n=1 Tax=Amycolatopsis anabasis TaxID=1840409 RepID=UPI00131E7659|nr:DUF4328 domain-containing protein [Amycolatopsis anabasis]
MHPGHYQAPRPPAPGPRVAGPPRARHRVRWVASIPPGVNPPRRAIPVERYLGPPSYPVPPRWGFPNLTWRFPTAVPGTASDEPRAVQRVRLLARNAVAVLWVLTALAVISGGAEVWRYALLVRSRTSALDTDVVGVSDALVITASLLTCAFALIATASALWWLFVARAAAADEAGQVPARSSRQVLVGVLVPGLNLVLSGSILAELEHTVLRRPADRRPRPSRLVRWWWAAWVANWVLLVVAIWWLFRDGTQALADGVVLHALTDFAAAGLAAASALVVRRLTELLAPVDQQRLRSWRVLKVTGAPDPALRPARPAGSAR